MKPNEALEKMNFEYRSCCVQLSEIQDKIWKLKSDLEENRLKMTVMEWEYKKAELERLQNHYKNLDKFNLGIEFAREILMEVDGAFDE